MRLTKRQLKRIIREEYSRLKRQGLIIETNEVDDQMTPEEEEEYYDHLIAQHEEMEDGRYEREDAMYRKQIGESRRRRLREGQMKRLYGEIQNAILAAGQDLGGEITVMDAVEAVVEAVPMMDRPSHDGYALYEEILDIMYDMVDAGMLTGGYEDFFDVHPDYM